MPYFGREYIAATGRKCRVGRPRSSRPKQQAETWSPDAEGQSDNNPRLRTSRGVRNLIANTTEKR